MNKQKISQQLIETINILLTHHNQLNLSFEQRGPKCQFKKDFFNTFKRNIDLSKMKIKLRFQSVLNNQNLSKIQQEETRLYFCVINKLATLNNNIQFLLKDGLFNLYMQLNELRQSAQRENFTSITQQMMKFSLQVLNKLLKQYFVYQQYEIRKKAHHKQNELDSLLSQKSINTLENLTSEKFFSLKSLDDKLLKEVEQFIQIKPLAELFELEMKKQERRIGQINEICRICSFQIKIKDIERHVYICAKKCDLKLQLEAKDLAIASLEERIKNKYMQSCEDLVKQPIDQEFRNICKLILHFPKKNEKGVFRNSLIGLKGEKYFIHKIQSFILSFIQTYGGNQLLDEWLALFKEKTFIQKRLNSLQVSSHFSDKQQQSQQSEKKNQFRQNYFKRDLQQKGTFCSSYKSMSKFANLKSDKSIKISNQKHSLSSSHRSQSSQSKKIKPEEIFDRTKSKKSLSKKLGKESQQQIDCNVDSISHYASMPNLSKIPQNMQSKSNISLSSFQILKFLGQGAFGKVYMARRKRTKDVYALKIVKLAQNSQEKELQSVKNQYQIFKKIGGDHLVKAPFSFSQGSSQIFIMQYMPGGDLRKVLIDEVYFEQDVAKIYLAQIILAIQLLHQSGIIHRDLKPQNLVIDRRGHLKLTDFGLSEFQVNQKIEKSKKFQNENNDGKSSKYRKRRAAYYGVNKQKMKLIGSPDYIAPEIINQTSFSNYTIDWWSLGVMAYELMVGTRPFCGDTIHQIIDNITNFNIEWPQVGLEEGMMSPDAKDFITQLLNKNFIQRLGSKGADELKQHQFFKGIDWQNLKSSQVAFFPKKMTTLFQMASMQENTSLRVQIEEFIKDKKQKTKKVNLQTFVRYDLLKSETIANMQRKHQMSTKKLKRLNTLRQIACEFQQKTEQFIVI